MARNRCLIVGAVVGSLAVAGASGTSTSAAGSPATAPGWEEPTDLAIDIRPTEITRSTRLTESFGPVVGEHVALLGADAWHDAGIDGSGVTIGVIDFFDVPSYWDVAEHGPRPVAGATAVCFDDGEDCTDEFFDGEDLGGEEHGVAVVETILDAAPGAEILIGQAVTVDDYDRLVDWFASRGVDVISRSLGSRYDGPGDGRGALDEVAERAVGRGMLWVNSAGNNGRDKYYRHPVRLVGDRVAFGPSGTSTFLRFTGCIALAGVRWANDWDTAPSARTDYDLNLWDSPTGDPGAGTIVDRSRRPQRLGASPIEYLPADRCPSSGSSLYLEVVWNGGDTTGDVLEILDYGAGIASFTSAAGSAAVSVVDSASPGVIGVGAIDPAAGDTIARYSSQGPTNDGRVVPDLVAPANFANTVQGRFAGTSAAAAVVAGAAALLLDGDLATGPVALADLLRHEVTDLGPSGADNTFGSGRLRLPDPPPAGGVDGVPSSFVALDVPVRALDTRPDSAAGPAELIGRIRRGEILELPVAGALGAPADGVTAVAVNVVSVAPDRASFVQALPTGVGTVGGFSTLNIDGAGQIRANFAIVPVGVDGTISLYSIADGHLVVDLLGWFERTSGAVAAGRFVEISPSGRLLDTREQGPALATGDVRTVPMPAGVDPTVVDALVVTVTATEAEAPGWLQAIPADRPDIVGTTSTVNTGVGGAVANTAIVPVSGSGIAVTGSFGPGGRSHVVVDVVGYVTGERAPVATGGRFVAVRPGRAFDSRIARGPLGDERTVVVDGSDAPGVSVPEAASGIVWNAAVVDAVRPGFARTWRAGGPRPPTSTLNWSRVGEIRAAAVISAVDAGRARFELDDGGADLPGPIGDLIVDVFGYFT